MEIKFRIWIEENDKVLFGKGRRDLLEAIKAHQSLSAAAKELNMSYRAAWGRLRASENRLGIKLVDVDPSHKGMKLTNEACQLLELFEALERDTKALIKKASAKLLPFISLHQKH